MHGKQCTPQRSNCLDFWDLYGFLKPDCLSWNMFQTTCPVILSCQLVEKSENKLTLRWGDIVYIFSIELNVSRLILDLDLPLKWAHANSFHPWTWPWAWALDFGQTIMTSYFVFLYMSLHCHALYVVLSLFLSGLKSTESSGSLKLPEQERSVPIPGAGRRSSLADIAITLHTQSRGFFEGGILYAGITQILIFWYFELKKKRILDHVRR